MKIFRNKQKMEKYVRQRRKISKGIRVKHKKVFGNMHYWEVHE